MNNDIKEETQSLGNELNYGLTNGLSNELTASHELDHELSNELSHELDHENPKYSRNFSVHFKPFDKRLEQRYYSFKYFSKLKYSVNPNTDEKHRMTSFSGGKYFFPYDKRFEVLKYISYDIQTENPVCYTQVAYDREGEGSRLILDIDSDSRILSDLDIITIVDTLQETLKEYFTQYTSQPINTFVSFCGPRIKKNQLSSGLHIISHVRVSVQQGKQICFGFKLRLFKKMFFDKKGLSFDDSIYHEKDGSSVLRMIYNHKVEVCPFCNGADSNCGICNGNGRTISTSTYEPKLCVINGQIASSEEFNKHHSNFEQMVRNHSIWPEFKNEYRTDYKKPEFDSDYILQEAFKQKRANKGVETKDKDLMKMVKPVVRDSKTLSQDNPVYFELEKFIQNILYNEKQPWTNVNISSIKLAGKDPKTARRALVCLSGQGCTYCLYKQDNHKTNRVFFELDGKCRLTLRCNSEKHGCKGKKDICFNVPSYITSKVVCLHAFKSNSKSGQSIQSTKKLISFTTNNNNNNKQPRKKEEIDAEKELYLKKIKLMYSN